MDVRTNVSLANFSTMRLGGIAAHLTEVGSRQELSQAITWATNQNLPTLMIGGGSNVIWRDEGFPGLVLVNRIKKYEQFDEDETNSYLTIGSGEDWDDCVARSVAAGLSGIEALSLIPGTAGATPIQNVGAYGQDISQTLVTVEAFDRQTGQFSTMPASDCGFGYRTSRFKTTDRQRFYITAITLHLTKTNPEGPYYPALQEYFSEHQLSTITPSVMRQAVIAIRSAKLPDPKVVANNGSFFANPVISEAELVQLEADGNDQVPHWSSSQPGMVKVSAAWLVEKAGFRAFHDPVSGMATWPTQSLVLVNEAAKSTADVLAFKQQIVIAVQTKFGITLEQEPELLP